MRLLPALLTALALGLGLSGCAARPPANPFVTGRPWILAHQGGEALWPSNTVLAFRSAAKLGVDMLDTDMHATRDGVLVLSHDDTVDRLTNGHGRIRDLTLAQLRRFDAGYRFTTDGLHFPFRGRGLTVPTLDEALAAVPGLPWTIEIKQAEPSLAVPFCAALRRHHMTGRVIVASFSDTAMQDFRAACPEVATSMTERELRPLVLAGKLGLGGLARAPGAAAQVPPASGPLAVATAGFVRAMHARGVAVHVWTINDPAEMRRLLDLGVDGLDTDRPDLMKQVLAERQGK